MIDPITAFATAQTAVAAIKKGIQLGKDIGGISSDLAKFAGAISDLNFAHKRSEHQPWYAVLLGGDGDNAMDIFAKKKQAEAMRAEIKQFIQFSYGQSAWEELLFIEAQVRKDRQATMYRKGGTSQVMPSGWLGLGVGDSGLVSLGWAVYFIVKRQERG